MDTQHYDMLIIGAGLSGIAAAYHYQRRCPGKSFALLEARKSMGGTWDLFRYPGIRSDSDMHTHGYSFRPWKEKRSVALGPDILKYIKETASEFDLDKKILYDRKLIEAHWSSASKRWNLTVENTQTKVVLRFSCRFLFMCTGYYDYDQGFTPSYPGPEDFKGIIIHPQKWDESIDYEGKKVVVIGSGATAVTLVPELAKKASQVTMLQRSPTYIASLPSVDGIAELIKKILPEALAYKVIRFKNIIFGMAFFKLCRRFPSASRKVLLHMVGRHLGESSHHLKDFSPQYKPWDQRLCLVPDGDLFEALKNHRADVITDQIESFTEAGLKLKSGRTLDADIIISATGLKIKFLANLKVSVDGVVQDLPSLLPYKGAMFSGLPNFAMAFGYTNASWTLRCDLTAEWVAKVLSYMRDNGLEVVTPEANPQTEKVPLFEFTSGYIQRATEALPKQGQREPWRVGQNYFTDYFNLKFRPLADEGLKFTK